MTGVTKPGGKKSVESLYGKHRDIAWMSIIGSMSMWIVASINELNQNMVKVLQVMAYRDKQGDDHEVRIRDLEHNAYTLRLRKAEGTSDN